MNGDLVHKLYLLSSHLQDCLCSVGSICLKGYDSSAHQTVKTSCALIHHWICLQQKAKTAVTASYL